MKSITCADLLEDLFCSLETSVLEDNFLLRRAIFDFVLIISRLPKDLAMTELVVLGFDIMKVFHTTILAVLGEIVKKKKLL